MERTDFQRWEAVMEMVRYHTDRACNTDLTVRESEYSLKEAVKFATIAQALRD